MQQRLVWMSNKPLSCCAVSLLAAETGFFVVAVVWFEKFCGKHFLPLRGVCFNVMMNYAPHIVANLLKAIGVR